VDVLSTNGVNVDSGVTNASLVMVGVGAITIGSTWTAASVTNTAGAGDAVGEDGITPTRVGVGYSPQSDEEEALPMQELSNREIATNKEGSRFTGGRCQNYTCIDRTDGLIIKST
jgi:hypothetical protein